MKNLKELRAKLEARKAEGKVKLGAYNALADKAEALTDAERAQMASLDSEISAIENDVEQRASEIAAEEARVRRAGVFQPAAATGNSYSPARTMNEPNPETTGGFRSISEFATAVRNASSGFGFDDRLAALPSNTQQNMGGAGEGYLVPAEFRDAIYEVVFAPGELLAAVAPEPTSSNTVQIVRDESTPWGSTGVQANWRAEGTQMSASKQATKGAEVRLHELYAFVVATDELLSDAPRLQSRLTTKAGQAIRYKASDAIMWGDGVGKPLGFMNSGALVTVAKESGQTADTINATNIAKMFSRLLPGNLANAFWLANSDTLPQLMSLSINNQPIWTPPNAGFASAPGGFLLGRPIVFSEHADTLGDVGDINLIDPAGYFAANKAGGGIDFASSMHLYFDYGATAFRWTFRLGGQPYLSAPITPPRSTATKSHFVALADRA